jgi:integrase
LNYAESLLAFCKWCVQRRYLAENPLHGMAAFDTIPKSWRRAMTLDEVRRLLAVAPEHRALLYEVAIASGLRAGELRSLSLRHLDVDGGGLRLDASWTKNRRNGFQYLPRALIQRLKTFAESDEPPRLYERHYGRTDCKLALPEKPLLFVPTQCAREMEKDLKSANIPKWTPEGKLDFHACRVAYVTFIFEAGASAKEAQTMARHSTPNLTFNVYARARESRQAELAEKVGFAISAPQTAPQVPPLAAVGA